MITLHHYKVKEVRTIVHHCVVPLLRQKKDTEELRKDVMMDSGPDFLHFVMMESDHDFLRFVFVRFIILE